MRRRMGRLHAATGAGDVRLVRWLVAHEGLDVNEHSSELYPPLHIACRAGNLQMVRVLLENGADVNIKYDYDSWDGETCLHLACRRNNFKLAWLLMQYGADVNIVDSLQNHSAVDVAQCARIKAMFRSVVFERWLAFSMAFHPRLGAGSPARRFPKDLLPKLWHCVVPPGCLLTDLPPEDPGARPLRVSRALPGPAPAPAPAQQPPPCGRARVLGAPLHRPGCGGASSRLGRASDGTRQATKANTRPVGDAPHAHGPSKRARLEDAGVWGRGAEGASARPVLSMEAVLALVPRARVSRGDDVIDLT